MMMRRHGRTVFVVTVGLAVALFAYRWITDPEPRAARAREEQVVLAARQLLREAVRMNALEIVDALAPQRKVGKAYIYPQKTGWAVSGYYRRDEADRWHPYLLELSAELKLLSLRLDDETLPHLAIGDSKTEISR